jgi:hypothetical protein
MKKESVFFSILLFLFTLPATSMAVDITFPRPGNIITDIVPILLAILDLVWYIFFGVAVIMFILAGIQFLTARGDPGKIATARNAVIWGTIGVFVGILGFSIVEIIKVAFNLQ